jgi:hypothetical protein
MIFLWHGLLVLLLSNLEEIQRPVAPALNMIQKVIKSVHLRLGAGALVARMDLCKSSITRRDRTVVVLVNLYWAILALLLIVVLLCSRQ